MSRPISVASEDLVLVPLKSKSPWCSRHAILWISVAFLLAQFLGAQPRRVIRPLHVQSYLERGGLRGCNLFQVDFTTDGHVWIAASNGLHCYDGYHWKQLTTHHGLPSNFVRCVMVEASGSRLWVGTDAGVAILALPDLSLQRTLVDELAGGNVRRIRHGTEGTVWVCSDRWLAPASSTSGLTRFRSFEGPGQRYTTLDGLPDDYVMDFYLDAAGRGWALTDNGLARFENDHFIAELVDLGPRQNECRIWSMVETRAGQLLASTQAGLYARDGSGWRRVHQWQFGNPQLATSLAGELIMPHPEYHRLLYLDAGELTENSPFHPGFNPFPFTAGPIRVEDICTAPDNTIWLVGRNLLMRWLQPGSVPRPQWQHYQRDHAVRFNAAGRSWTTTPEGFRQLIDGKAVPPRRRDDTPPLIAPAGTSVACSYRSPTGSFHIGTDRGLYRLSDDQSFWEPVHLGDHLQPHSLTGLGDELWYGVQDPSTGTSQLMRLAAGQRTAFAIDVRRCIDRAGDAAELFFIIDGGLCVIPSPGEAPYIINVAGDVTVANAIRSDDRVLWLDLQTSWLSFTSDGIAPETRCKAQATVAAGDAMIVQVSADEWFLPPDPDRSYSVSTQLNGGAWSPFSILRHGELHLRNLPAGPHSLAVRVRDEGLDTDPTPQLLEFRVVRHGLPLETLLLLGGALLGVLGFWGLLVRRRHARLDSFRRLLGKSGAAILTVARSGIITEASPQARQLLRITDADLGQLRLLEILDGDQHGQQTWQKLLDRGTIEGVECQFRTRNNTVLTAVMSAVRTAGPRDAARGFRILLHDTTGARAVEQQLRQAQKMEGVGQLAGGIAHDFNNLLCGIIGYADLIRERFAKPGADAEIHDYADQIVKTGRSAADLTQQLLTFSRQGVLRPVPTNIHEIFEDVRKLLSRTIDRRIEVRIGNRTGEAIVHGDRTQIYTAILNLTINARDAMPDGGTLTLSTATHYLDADSDGLIGPGIEPGEFLGICVTDTGTGIAKEDYGLIFEPFFTTKEVGHGTGLGLATVYGTVVTHRGAALVDSRLGQGTSMFIFLPLDSHADPSAGLPQPQPVTQAEGTILVVDDEPVVCSMIEQVLQLAGYRVLSVRDGRAAVELFRSCEPGVDLVLMDMIMPKMSGRDAMEAIRAIAPEVSFMISTGFVLTQGELELLDLGAAAVLQKPYTNDILVRRVAEVLARIRAPHSRQD